MWTCEFNDTILSCAQPCCPLQHIQYAHSPAIHHRTFHKHTHCHLMFCTGGRGFLRVNNLEIQLKPGILAVIRPGEYHCCGAAEDSDLEFWALSFSSAGEDDELYHSITDGSCVSASFEDYLDYVQGAFRFIHMLATNERPGNKHSPVLLGQILSLIQFAQIMWKLHPLDIPADDLPLREMLDWISEHYAENITLSGLSREFAMSTSHLSRSFFCRFPGLAHQLPDRISVKSSFGSIDPHRSSDSYGRRPGRLWQHLLFFQSVRQADRLHTSGIPLSLYAQRHDAGRCIHAKSSGHGRPLEDRFFVSCKTARVPMV